MPVDDVFAWIDLLKGKRLRSVTMSESATFAGGKARFKKLHLYIGDKVQEEKWTVWDAAEGGIAKRWMESPEDFTEFTFSTIIDIQVTSPRLSYDALGHLHEEIHLDFLTDKGKLRIEAHRLGTDKPFALSAQRKRKGVKK